MTPRPGNEEDFSTESEKNEKDFSTESEKNQEDFNTVSELADSGHILHWNCLSQSIFSDSKSDLDSR